MSHNFSCTSFGFKCRIFDAFQFISLFSLTIWQRFSKDSFQSRDYFGEGIVCKKPTDVGSVGEGRWEGKEISKLWTLDMWPDSISSIGKRCEMVSWLMFT